MSKNICGMCKKPIPEGYNHYCPNCNSNSLATPIWIYKEKGKPVTIHLWRSRKKIDEQNYKYHCTIVDINLEKSELTMNAKNRKDLSQKINKKLGINSKYVKTTFNPRW